MHTNLGFCLALHSAHASLQLKLDDELGIYHGISFNDFALLNLLAQADGGRVSIPALVRPMGQPQSAVLRQLIVLEKIGLVVRDGANGFRQAVLRPAGRALVSAARETADSICTEAVASIAPAALEMVSAALVTLAHTPNLAIS
ncbi:helix-turn-helix domain-containing protein [Undibacterium sp. CCC2.1]|nr:helix-turn-helix domain-containing protein [Undibacterium sp. CCC3.4]MEB0141194.1 helix-turn-helix domain-containing protein [Undibacterium sp. CCC2.1]MEB0174240.1 helix-turn-helix domain-containing protein [Undibacterium sp. CCC1.1]MEB0217395.1 helix-turn-helix domain-containing protein [Undibacterium sp. 5I2]MEB0178183.1 helix-turn-helix domain-containing protein [Undibacterium sp. CCC3.4]WPX45575.1 helix-turn-helix domain-containing protein [Undibacterium sp. CCC3.4]